MQEHGVYMQHTELHLVFRGVLNAFPAVGVKNPLDVFAARLGPLGHGPGFGGFLYPGKPVWLSFNEKTVGPFTPLGRVFFKMRTRMSSWPGSTASPTLLRSEGCATTEGAAIPCSRRVRMASR